MFSGSIPDGSSQSSGSDLATELVTSYNIRSSEPWETYPVVIGRNSPHF